MTCFFQKQLRVHQLYTYDVAFVPILFQNFEGSQHNEASYNRISGGYSRDDVASHGYFQIVLHQV